MQRAVALRRQQEDDTLATLLEGLAGLQIADEKAEEAERTVGKAKEVAFADWR
jgi:Flp pilus assembly protein TadD